RSSPLLPCTTRFRAAEQFGGVERYIIPGVGHAGAAMEKLRKTGLLPLIGSATRPVLGICLGMQLLTAHSEEGDSGLTGIIPLKTDRKSTRLNSSHVK